MGALIIEDNLSNIKPKLDNPLVSVVVSVYNHKDYIERCMRGIAMQKTDFPVEVWVGEDCSPDGTADVLRELAPTLPDGFNLILRQENLGGRGNGRDLWSRVRGKYCAFVEGDDFWTDENKLQRQVDFLEAHPDYAAVYSKVYVVGEDSEPNGEKYPQYYGDDYPLSEYFYSTPPGHWSTLMCRWEQFYDAYRTYINLDSCAPYQGDRRNTFLLLSLGELRCMDEVTGAYRHVTSKGTSFSASFCIDEKYAENEILFGQSLVDFAELTGNEAMREIAKRTYYRFLLKWSVGKVKVRKLSDSLSKIMREPRLLSYLTAPLQWYAVLAFRMLTGRSVDL